jgi:O-antigen/teichoic acid export membrane protein
MIASLQIIIAIFLISLILIFLFSSFVQEILFRKFSYIEGLQNSPIVFVSSIFFLITTFAMVASYVLLANHKGPIALLLNPTGQVISMILIVLANHNNIFKNNILAAILIFSLPQALFFGIAFFVVFKKYLKQLFSVNKEIIKNLSIRSIKFQAITILYLMVGQIDMIIISQTLSSYYIIIYNSFMRFFMLPIFVFTTFLGSSWPRFSEMFIRKEFSTLKIILKRYYLYAFVLVLFCTAGIYIFAPQVLKFLLPTIDVVYNKSLIIIFGAWTLITCWTEIAKVFLSSINAVRVMFMVLPFQIIISVGAQFVFSQKYQAEGIIFALFVSLLLTTFWALPLKMFKVLKKEGDSLL